MARYALGQPIRLSTTVRDVTGAPVAAGTLTLTVQKPDLTQQVYASPTNDGVGLYHQDIPAGDLTQLGLHQYKWVSTGAGAGVVSGSFEVSDPLAPSLLSLEDAKAQLNVTATVNDDELRTFVAAASAMVERFVGPVGLRVVTEQVSGDRWVLSSPPVVSITSVTAALSGLAAWPVADLAFSPAGVVTHGSGYPLGGPYTVVYRAGSTVVPPAVGLAARIILQHLWSTQRGGSSRPGMGGGGGGYDAVEQQMALQGFAIPRRAKELLEGHMLAGFG